jgi:hypothetical protein
VSRDGFARYDEFNLAAAKFMALADVGAMLIGSFLRPGAFDSEAAMSEALDAVFEELRRAGPPKVVREIIATRIITAIRLGQRDPARLPEAALTTPRGRRD